VIDCIVICGFVVVAAAVTVVAGLVYMACAFMNYSINNNPEEEYGEYYV